MSPAKLYPGLGLPLRYHPQTDPAYRYRADTLPTFPLGSHPNILGSESDLLPVREVAMLAIMDRLTDKPMWNRKVFDEAIVSKWKDEALAVPDEEWMKVAAAPGSGWDQPPERHQKYENGQFQWVEKVPTKLVGIMSERAFDFCVKELRSKACYYEKTGLVPTLDASAAVVKSDVLVEAELHDSLEEAFRKLQDEQADDPDWHPQSGGMVQDLVDPSMFPLVYGRSKVLRKQRVNVIDAIGKWAGKGEVIPEVKESGQEESNTTQGRSEVLLGSTDIPNKYWSTSYQWLPSNVSFRKGGGVKLKSYINNLHPTNYPDIYATVEKLIETAIPAWNQSLLEFTSSYHHFGPGQKGSRFSVPDEADEETADNWSPSDRAELADSEVDFSKDVLWDHIENEEERKWKILRTPVLREPDPFKEVEYDPQKTTQPSGRSRGNYRVPERSGGVVRHWSQVAQARRFLMGARVHPTAKSVVGGLRDKFRKPGLQIIVKMSSIELTPEKPEFASGGWQIEGLMNEKICATALYYLDSENITESSLSFRMQTSYDQDVLQSKVGQDSYHWLECNYGTRFHHTNGSCIQNYGSVKTSERRLLAFPNVFQHRVSPFELVDKQKPGHQRFIVLWLVDPHQRIISTANVPPQQQNWWVRSIFGESVDEQQAATEKFPAEFVQLLREEGVDLPSVDNGKQLKLTNELLDLVRQDFSLGTFSA
ncbi:hypothetical protein N0V82_003245 [Gnomoniopsis sp. IMI 355080]|nr:hypothetical protein N0V82_003245 [Gnomoniopsis sp. IMI 355080]